MCALTTQVDGWTGHWKDVYKPPDCLQGSYSLLEDLSWPHFERIPNTQFSGFSRYSYQLIQHQACAWKQDSYSDDSTAFSTFYNLSFVWNFSVIFVRVRTICSWIQCQSLTWLWKWMKKDSGLWNEFKTCRCYNKEMKMQEILNTINPHHLVFKSQFGCSQLELFLFQMHVHGKMLSLLAVKSYI